MNFVSTGLLFALASISVSHAVSARMSGRGEALHALCASCHGEKGEGLSKFETPALAGLPFTYLERQLRDFRSGRRGSHPQDTEGLRMRPMAKVLLKDEDLVAVARHVASLPAPPAVRAQSTSSKVSALARTCLGCHGGERASPVTPPLFGRGPDYLKSQLDKYARGLRGYHPSHPEGRLMAGVARSLLGSDGNASAGPEELEELVSFLHAVPSVSPPRRAELQACASCHGPDMRGNRFLGTPSIAGLDKQYLLTQFENFRTGARGGHPEDSSGNLMRLAARLYLPARDDNASLDRLAAVISGLEPKPQANTIGGDAVMGRAHYAVCMGCHGLKGEGNPALRAPAHKPLEDWYALEQLKKFKDGRRGVHPEDVWGKTMVPILATLPNEEAMRDVIAYMRSLASPGGKPNSRDDEPKQN